MKTTKKVKINKKIENKVNDKRVIINGTEMLPLKEVCEMLNFKES